VGFQEYQQALSEANVDLSVPWMSPKDKGAVKERNRAEALLTTLPSMDDAFAKAASQLQTLKGTREGSYSWIGWLAHAEDGSWRVETSLGRVADGKLVVIVKPPAGKTASIEDIGDAKSGEVRVTS